MEIMKEIGKIGKDIEKFDKIRSDYNGIIGNHFALSLINFINKEETDSYDKNEIIDLIYKFTNLYSVKKDNKKDNKKSSSSTKSKKDGSGIRAYQEILKQYKEHIYEENPDISKSNATEQAREMYRANKESDEQKELYSSLVEQFKSSTETKINSDDKEDKIVFVSVKENTSDNEDDKDDEIQPIKKKNIKKNTKKSKNKKKGKMKKNYSSDSDSSSKESSSDDSSDDDSINLSKIKTNSSDESSSEDDL